MSTPNVQQNLYQQKVNGMISEVNSLKGQVSEVENRVLRVDEKITKLPTRISSIRQMNYRIQTNLEGDQAKATEIWGSMAPAIKTEVSSKTPSLKNELNSLESSVNIHRISSTYNLMELSGLDLRLNTDKILVNDFSTQIIREMSQIEGILTPIEQGVATAEEVVKLISAASFQWKDGETPVVSVYAKDMNEKTNGVLTLTNQRIIYENEKEIVLKKTLFLVTEKKLERTTTLERPIGTINRLTKGRVGLLAGAGLYIEFKQGDQQLKLDTKGEEADSVVKYYGLITSGQIDEELSKLKPATQKTVEKRIISCPKCGAPYTNEIYRGQLAVQCKYCGTTITVNN